MFYKTPIKIYLVLFYFNLIEKNWNLDVLWDVASMSFSKMPFFTHVSYKGYNACFQAIKWIFLSEPNQKTWAVYNWEEQSLSLITSWSPKSSISSCSKDNIKLVSIYNAL